MNVILQAVASSLRCVPGVNISQVNSVAHGERERLDLITDFYGTWHLKVDTCTPWRFRSDPSTYISTTTEEGLQCDNLILLRDHRAIDTFQNFLGYVTDRSETPVKLETVILAHFDACICTDTCLVPSEEDRSGDRQIVHSDTRHSIITFKNYQFCMNTVIWETGKRKYWEWRILHQWCYVLCKFISITNIWISYCPGRTWPLKYECSDVHKCFLASADEWFSSIIQLEMDLWHTYWKSVTVW